MYRHKKGGLYCRKFEARHTETGESLTVYIGTDGRVWARPSAMFHDGRFTPIGKKWWFIWFYKYSCARLLVVLRKRK